MFDLSQSFDSSILMMAAKRDTENDSAISTKFLKPKRPLSAYNLFYKAMRERYIMSGGQAGEAILDLPVTVEEIARLSLENKNKPPAKRVHRRTHGCVSFVEMAKTVGSRWKQLPPAYKKLFTDQAKLEKLAYEEKMKEWKSLKSTSSNDDVGDASSDGTLDSFAQEEMALFREDALSPAAKDEPQDKQGNAPFRMDQGSTSRFFPENRHMRPPLPKDDPYEPFIAPEVLAPPLLSSFGQRATEEKPPDFKNSEPLDSETMDNLFD